MMNEPRPLAPIAPAISTPKRITPSPGVPANSSSNISVIIPARQISPNTTRMNIHNPHHNLMTPRTPGIIHLNGPGEGNRPPPSNHHNNGDVIYVHTQPKMQSGSQFNGRMTAYHPFQPFPRGGHPAFTMRRPSEIQHLPNLNYTTPPLSKKAGYVPTMAANAAQSSTLGNTGRPAKRARINETRPLSTGGKTKPGSQNQTCPRNPWTPPAHVQNPRMEKVAPATPTLSKTVRDAAHTVWAMPGVSHDPDTPAPGYDIHLHLCNWRVSQSPPPDDSDFVEVHDNNRGFRTAWAKQSEAYRHANPWLFSNPSAPKKEPPEKDIFTKVIWIDDDGKCSIVDAGPHDMIRSTSPAAVSSEDDDDWEVNRMFIVPLDSRFW